jgi:hypothetical protein
VQGAKRGKPIDLTVIDLPQFYLAVLKTQARPIIDSRRESLQACLHHWLPDVEELEGLLWAC